MKKLLLLFMFLSIPCYSQPYVAVKSSYFMPDDDNFKPSRFTHCANGVEVGYSLNKYVDIGIEGYLIRFKSNWGTSFKDYSLMAVAKVGKPIKKFKPYVTAGVGTHYFTDKKLVSPYERIEGRHGFGWKAGVGVEYSITTNWITFLEADYRYGDTGDISTLDNYGFNYGGGVKYKF